MVENTKEKKPEEPKAEPKKGSSTLNPEQTDTIAGGQPLPVAPPTPEQEKAAQDFADKMVKNIIEKLPPKPAGAPAFDLSGLMTEIQTVRHNQYIDHLILEKIWTTMKLSDADARIIDNLANKDRNKRRESKKEVP